MRYGAEQGSAAKPQSPSLLRRHSQTHLSYPLLLAFLFLCCEPLAAETVDRLAITVGSTVITQLQIDEDLRVAALLNGQPVVRDLGARRAAADRLVEQLLIQHEIQLSRYPAPSVEEVETLYSRVEATMGGSSRLRQLLIEFNLSDETLRAHLQAQLATLRFIEFRFRPDINISDSEIEAAYRRKLAESGAASPAGNIPLDAQDKAKLAEALMAERTDAALNGWLAESRKQFSIVYLDTALQ
jgi:hypothetical protein